LVSCISTKMRAGLAVAMRGEFCALAGAAARPKQSNAASDRTVRRRRRLQRMFIM
jgi:hypothetical protein